MKKLTKSDIILAGGVIALSAAVLFARACFKQPAGDTVNIYVDNALYTTASVRDYGDITIDRGDGRINIISIGDDGVRMKYSTCKNQLCVQSGCLSSSRASMPDGWIICLPNGVSAELVSGNEG